MEFDLFKEELIKNMNFNNIEISETQVNQFYKYMNLMIEWNKKINLTAIKEPKEIIIKHFVDCATISKYIKENRIIDVGTGAGFPGIPLKIMNKDLKITLLDSLNKRIKFLNTVIKELKLKDIQTIHGRAEDIAKDFKYRECYDIAVSRAVAPLNVLLEYTVPFIKIKGKVICMKGNNIEEEVNTSKKAINVLGTKLLPIEKVKLQHTDIIRNIIIVEKSEKTPDEYPRKSGIPTKRPL